MLFIFLFVFIFNSLLGGSEGCVCESVGGGGGGGATDRQLQKGNCKNETFSLAFGGSSSVLENDHIYHQLDTN